MIRTKAHGLIDFARSAGGNMHEGSVITAMERAPKFTLDAFPDDDARVMLEESGELLHSLGLLKLPYPETCFEFELNLTGDNPLDSRVLPCTFVCLAVQTDNEPDHITTYPSLKLHGRWVLPLTCFKFAMEGKKAVGYKEDAPPDVLRNIIQNGFADEYEMCQTAGAIAVPAIVLFLALLHTRGITKEDIPAPSRLNKARLRKRKTPIDAVTVIRVQKHMTGKSRGPVGERHAPRLHMRRAHLRNQHYGPGNSKVRQIPIHAMLIGHEDQGTIMHDHYEVDPG